MQERTTAVLLLLATLVACEKATISKAVSPPPRLDTEIDLPAVKGAGVVPFDPTALRIEATPTGVEVAGDKVIVAAGERRANNENLRNLLARHRADSIILLVQRDVTYDLLLEILRATADAGRESPKLSLAVRANAQDQALPLALPGFTATAVEVKPASDAKPGDAFILKPGESLPEWADPVLPVVSINAAETRLFSLTGAEGTAAQPKGRWTQHDPTAVAEAVAEIVTRRYAKRRPQQTDSIIIMAGPNVTTQRVADIVDAVRPSFPNVMLSGVNF